VAKYLLLGFGAIMVVALVSSVPLNYFDRIAELRHASRPADIANRLDRDLRVAVERRDAVAAG
jgi:hypothetical protein